MVAIGELLSGLRIADIVRGWWEKYGPQPEKPPTSIPRIKLLEASCKPCQVPENSRQQIGNCTHLLQFSFEAGEVDLTELRLKARPKGFYEIEREGQRLVTDRFDAPPIQMGALAANHIIKIRIWGEDAYRDARLNWKWSGGQKDLPIEYPKQIVKAGAPTWLTVLLSVSLGAAIIGSLTCLGIANKAERDKAETQEKQQAEAIQAGKDFDHFLEFVTKMDDSFPADVNPEATARRRKLLQAFEKRLRREESGVRQCLTFRGPRVVSS